MKNIHKSVLIWYSPEEMFRLVTDVDHYPEFLPWCDKARVLEKDAHGMVAEVGISLGGIQQTFTTRNEHEEGRSVGMSLVQGPFSNLSGMWRFTVSLSSRKFQQPGIWGRKVQWTQLVIADDRIELYRPLKVDPKVARRQRFKRQGKGRTGLFAKRKSGSAAGY